MISRLSISICNFVSKIPLEEEFDYMFYKDYSKMYQLHQSVLELFDLFE